MAAKAPSALGSFGGTGEGKEEFPILCETCLGDNPYIRMTRERAGKACKICDRPFTVYRWQPGPRARFKKTELCHTCAKLKNVCQTCVLDLQFGLPVQVRDSALEEHEKLKMPISDVNREYMIEQIERDMDNGTNIAGLAPPGELGGAGAGYGKATGGATTALLDKLARKSPYYKRNAPHLCSFFAKGTCNRGALCPYRHEMPTTGELAHQNIKDRYYGQNDPVAKKMLRRSEGGGAGGGGGGGGGGGDGPIHGAVPPEDKTVTTLWVGGLDEKDEELAVLANFSKFGTATIRMIPTRHCAFITFTMRSAAEEAVRGLAGAVTPSGKRMKIAWGKRRADSGPSVSTGGVTSGGVVHHDALAFLRTAPFLAPGSGSGSGSTPAATPLPAPPGMRAPAYPSMDPRHLSARMPM